MAGTFKALRRCLLVVSLIIVFTFCCDTVDSVIMSPRHYSSNNKPSTTSNNSVPSIPYAFRSLMDPSDSEIEPYLLSFNQGSDVDVMVNSKSLTSINLNRAVEGQVVVTCQVFSGPNLIEFDSKSDQPTGNNSLPNGNSTVSQTNLTIVYELNTFGDRIIDFHTRGKAGHAEIVCKVTKKPDNITIDDSTAYISVNIGKSCVISSIIIFVGWMYFLAWSSSFYFQVILNYQRKSVVGLNFDFLALNLLGFTCYSIYNFTMMFSREVQKDYYEKNTYSRIPVEYNDLFFSLHAFLLTLVTVIQCFIYERGEQKVSIPAAGFLISTTIAGLCLYTYHLFEKWSILNVVLYLSYVKLAVTIIKYSPQAYMNYKRKTTTGWSIHNILLDFTGGILSLAQMFFLAYNYDDWISIFGNFTKFGLGVISISFDIVFVVQHYVLYKQIGDLDITQSDEVPSPIISQSIRSLSNRQPSYTQAQLQAQQQQDQPQEPEQPDEQQSQQP